MQTTHIIQQKEKQKHLKRQVVDDLEPIHAAHMKKESCRAGAQHLNTVIFIACRICKHPHNPYKAHKTAEKKISGYGFLP